MAVEAVNEKSSPQFRLSRLNIFLFSFNQARRFSTYILRRKLHAIKNPYAKAKLVHSAFSTSLIVSYSRPFHKSNEPAGLRVSLREAVQTVLFEAEEIALHYKVIDKRDRVFAHSDSSAHEIEGWNYDGPAVQIYKAAFEPLTREETRLLSIMIQKWINHVEHLRSEVKESLRGRKDRKDLQ